MSLNSMHSRPTIPLPSRSSSPSFTQSGGQETAAKQVAAEVYRNVWDEFYRWKTERNAQTLRQLCVEIPDVYERERDRLSIDEAEDDDWVSDHDYPSSFSSSIDPDEAQTLNFDMAFLSFREPTLDNSRFRVTRYGHIPEDLLDEHYDDSEFEVDSYGLSIRSAFPGESPGIDSTFRPHPRYFSCTSASRNKPDTDSTIKLNFCAFEDDPAFDLQGVILSFVDLGWQTDFLDPDVEMIQLETVRQLHYQKGFSFAKVDSLRMFSELRVNHQSGLLWNTSQRDLLRWPGMLLSELPELTLSDYGHMPPDEDLSAHLKVGVTKFCPNLNCIIPQCQLHAKTEYPVSDPKPPLLTSEALYSKKKGRPCSDYCFSYLDLTNEFQAEEDIHWEDEADIKTLDSILQLAPDSLPCDLASIMHMKCQDVFVYRRRLFPDTSIDESPSFERTNQLGQHQFDHRRTICLNVLTSLLYLPVGTKGLVVVIQDVNVSSPDIIVDGIAVVIRNLIQIKQGSWGLGAFTLSSLQKGQAIGEYTGRILANGEDKTVPITDHVNLNYKFDLNKGFIIDSMYVGNEMRYLNHMGPKRKEDNTNGATPEEEANCRGRVIYVNRDHRIVFYTECKIPANAELFIDYGINYWNAKDDEDSGEKPEIYWR
ncbi:hypothetical protein AGABI2DRAFT_120473 [Agaricus bisporus var. bisporus H97]|uniref:hypothetical protein n=1 Tax=Agaricus bisporus var. bisporus (strain H97 / ATCC MYA-4626 / FGSC 10389) TaxID=936046 RepID=UPI00029F75A7|nr:hypothetical protein AGABI2DRAFT_120473 [Agaricus bisporus var. bisporus H97]EKV44340.1 hypothetical protein AGABI2DRAFT_120473 [Agaricus bisporus var. bisporus H97]